MNDFQWGIVGLGKLGLALISHLQPNTPIIHSYHCNRQVVLNTFRSLTLDTFRLK